jgi:predicted secreted hydrolase
MRRRDWLWLPLVLATRIGRTAVTYPRVTTGTRLEFPRDDGSHAAFRTEWWYVTAWLRLPDGQAIGCQVTFFRSRPGVAESLHSAFAPKQLLFAHAALADPRRGRLLHAQRAARSGFDLASASEDHLAVHIDDWSLESQGDAYRARVAAREFAIALEFRATQALLLQGESGVSRKGPEPAEASFYYSRPQLEVSGHIVLDERALTVTGTAWLDHEWSSEILAPQARGWDWIGINLDDGGALMAFRIRDQRGGALWAGATLRDASGRSQVYSPAEVHFDVLRRWRSPRTGIAYPVAFAVRVGSLAIRLEPLMDDQELDARASVGIVYWEGAVRALADAGPIGHGYLELTGYGERPRV